MASTLPTDELWITYGSKKNVQNIPAVSLGPDKASTLSMFYAPNGCDTVSPFRGRGKKNGSGCVELVFITDTSAKSPQSITARDRSGMRGRA